MNSESTSALVPASAATIAPLTQTTRPIRPRRRRTMSSPAAQGESMVWLSGGALSVAISMVVGLLAFIFWQGIGTFWPVPLVQLEKTDHQIVLGEVTDEDTYRPGDEVFASLSPEIAAAARKKVDQQKGIATRRNLRTGNFELSKTDFTWVDEQLVAKESLPQWAVVFERLTWGRMYATPTAFIRDGQEVAKSPAEAWKQFEDCHDTIRKRWEQRVSLQKYDLGAVSRVKNNAWLDITKAELAFGKNSPEKTAAEEKLHELEQWEETESTRISGEIKKLDQENDRYKLRVTTGQGQTVDLAVVDIVRAYPANQLGFWSKLGVYFSRWSEFLFGEPREANSEGGVFPAIWGTVAMTLTMSLLVVPFGVLAALYLREYAKSGWIVSAVRIAINNLAGVPSIVFGVFGLGFFCYGLGKYIDVGPDEVARWTSRQWWTWFSVLLGVVAGAIGCGYWSLVNEKESAGSKRRWLGRGALILWLLGLYLTYNLAAHAPFFHGFFEAKAKSSNAPTFGTGGLMWSAFTLALLTLPVVIVATEEALSAVPKSMREGSYACGASKWQTIRRIVLPRALPGIMTGTILAMARGAGEVAPLMLVGVVKLVPDLPVDGVFPFVHPDRSFMHLGFHIFDVALQSRNSEAAKPMVFTTTLLLIAIIATLNIAAVWLRGRLRRKFVAAHF